MSWNARWFEITNLLASWSKDTSTKVGCVIVDKRNTVLSLGWNGIPRGVEDEREERDARPEKYYWYEHAERNAIYNAAATGRSLEGSTIFVNLLPCADCARGIIQSGIRKVVTPPLAMDWQSSRWGEDFKRTLKMFKEAGVEVEWMNSH